MQKQVIKFTNRSPYPNSIFIGNEDDNLARQVQFVLPSEIDGAKIYLHLSIGEYSDVIELDDSLIYVPTRTHTQYPGNWTGYLEAHADNDTVWHSNTFTFKVGDLPDSEEQIEQAYPSAIEEALRAVDTLTGVGARAVTLEPGSDATVSFEEDAEGKRTIIYGIPRGADGSGGWSDGATFTPSVSDEGVISWTNDKDLPNPDPVNIKGETGAAGADGKSAYQYAEDGGYTGTQEEFAAKLAEDHIPVPATAEVGQTIVVKAVDEDGKPTEWETANMAGGNNNDYNYEKVIVLQEAVSEYILDKFDDGAPLALTSLEVISVTKNNTASTVYMKVLTDLPYAHNAGNITINTTGGYTGAEKWAYCWLDASIKNGECHAEFACTVNVSRYINYYAGVSGQLTKCIPAITFNPDETDVFSHKATKYTSVTVGVPAGAIESGSVIRIRGVRA